MTARPQSPRVPPGVAGRDGWLLGVVRDRRVAFLAVGAANTLVGGIWFVIFDSLMGEWLMGHYVALVCTYIASILFAFILYRRVVFRVHGHFLLDLARFSSVYLGSFVANIVLFAVLHNGLGVPPVATQIVNITLIGVSSYILHGNFSFARRQSDPERSEE